MRAPLSHILLIAITLASATAPASAQNFCDDPPSLSVLTGESVSVNGIQSEGHPAGFSWYITPPGERPSVIPTSTEATYDFPLSGPGLWSVSLVTDYEHQAPGGGLWFSETCVTVRASTVVASIELSSPQIYTDEELQLDGRGSQWANGVVPEVDWLIDGLPVSYCSLDGLPSSALDLTCTIPAHYLAAGQHTATLRLTNTDPVTGETSTDSGDFEVIQIVPLSVDFGWTPVEPDPGQYVNYLATVNPQILEEEFTRVTWDLGDGTVEVYDSCPPYFGSCLQWPHNYSTDGWYQVTVTVETADETASSSHVVEVGDPVPLPEASFNPSPASTLLLVPADFVFDGSCQGSCQWLWDFGDGSQSTAQHPTHVWEVPTSHTISLTVSNESGNDTTTGSVTVDNCWTPAPPVQTGSCYGGEVLLTAETGSAWSWSTGATAPTITAPSAGAYWVNVDNGSACWGQGVSSVVLVNCGDPTGDTNLDGKVDGADLAALIPELTDGDGDSVVGAGGGDRTAPGGDTTGDSLLRTDDLLTVLLRLYD